jgi:hypothetical protein
VHSVQVYELIGYLRKYPERWIKVDTSDLGGVLNTEPQQLERIKLMKHEHQDVFEDIDWHLSQGGKKSRQCSSLTQH